MSENNEKEVLKAYEKGIFPMSDSNYDPYDWEYYSNKPIGDASLVLTKGRVYLENDKPVTSLQFSMDATVDYELSSKLEGLNIVDFVEDGKRTFLIYSYDNKPIDQLTDVIFEYIDVNESVNLLIGTNGNILRNECSGQVIMKTQLSGMPECKVILF